MKTLTPTNTWILICSIVVASNATEHASSHHDVIQDGASTPWDMKHQNTFVPVAVQIPGNVLSTQDLSFISADNNIFEIMNKAQETCNGSDMRCTFYHFVNHGYENIGTLDIDKNRFDDLLMKFDNWLLTAENIDKHGNKTKGDSSVGAASIILNENSSISSDLHANQGVSFNHLDYIANESHGDRVNSHNIKIPHETHHRNYHSKDHNTVTEKNIHGKQWKDKNHIKLNAEYNKDHRYFEVYLPKDKVTGKPRTIYVEVDQDKNEFVLLDEEIDKKLRGIKPIRIELDELSEIADTAFKDLTKTSKFKEHVHNHLNDDEKAIINDISKHSAVNVDEVHLDIDVEEQTQNNVNPSVHHPNIYNIQAEQHNYNTIESVKNIKNNVIVPNKYITQAQFNIKPHIDISTDDIQNDYFELQENNNTETAIHTDFYEKDEPLDILEYNDNETFGANGTDNSSLDYSEIYENDNDTSIEYHNLSTDYENVSLNDDSVVQLEENNDTNVDVEFDNTHKFSASDTQNLNAHNVQFERPNQENNLELTKLINIEPKLTSPVTVGLSDYTVSTPSVASKMTKYLTPVSPSSSVECIEALNKDSKNTLHNFAVSWLPSYSRIEDLQLPCNPLSLDSSLQAISPPMVPNVGYSSNLQLPQDQLIPVHSSLFQNVPSHSFDVQELDRSTQEEVDAAIPLSPKQILLSKLGLPNSNTNTPFKVMPGSSKDAVTSPCSIPEIAPYLLSALSSPVDTGFIKKSPCDKTLKGTMISCAPCTNVYRYKTVPYLSNPYLKTPQLIPSFLESVLQTHLQPASKIPTLDSAPKSLEPSLTGVYPQEKQPIQFLPFAPKSQLSPLNPILIGPGFPPNALPCSTIMNNIPYLPYTDHNIRNNPPCISNYLTTDQYHKQLPSKTASLSNVGHPCSVNNILEITPSSYTPPFLPAQRTDLQNDLNPLVALERDLESLSLKYGIPLSKILHSIETETCFPTREVPNSNSKLDGLLIAQQPHILPKTEAADDENRSGNDEKLLEADLTNKTPLDSTLLGPHLELDESLKAHTSQSYTVTSDSTLPPTTSNLSVKNLPTKISHDSSLIGPQLSTLSTNNILFQNENQNGNVLSESDSSNLMPLEASLIGPYLKIGHSPVAFNSHISQGDIPSSHTEVLTTTLSQIKSVVDQNRDTNLLQDSSLTGSHLQSLSSVKPLLSNEIQIINEMVPLESEFTNLTPLDLSQIDLTKQLDQSSIPVKTLLTNEIQTFNEMVPLESELTNLIPLDLSQVDLTKKLDQSSIPVKTLITNEIQTINEMVPLESELTHLTPLDLSEVDLTKKLDQSSIPIKTLVTNEIKTINEMVPLGSDLTDLAPLDIAEADFVSELDQSKQHEKSVQNLSTGIVSTKSHKKTTSSNSIEEELLLEKELSSSVQLDSSINGPGLKLGNSPVATDTVKEDTIHLAQDNLEKTKSKVDKSETIILPSSLLPTLLNEPLKASYLNTISQDTILNENSSEMLLDANIIVEPGKPDMTTQNTQLNEKLSLDNYVEIPLAETTQISIKETEFKIIESNSVQDSNVPLFTKDATTLNYKPDSPELTFVDTEPQLESSLIGNSILPKIKTQIISSTLDSSIQLDNSLVGPSIINEIDSQSPIIETVDQFKNSISAITIDQNIKLTASTTIDSNIQLDSSLIGPTLNQDVKSQGSSVYDSVTQSETSLVAPSLYESGSKTSSVSLGSSLVIPSLASSASSSSSQLDSSLLGTSLHPHMETLKESRVFDSKKLNSVDFNKVGSHITTAPFSSDEIKMINKELQPKLDLINSLPLDSILIGPHVNFESQFDQSEISRYQNPESSLTTDIVPGILETLNFLNSDYVERLPPKLNTVIPSTYQSDLQELQSKFKNNSITKSQLTPSEFNPCDKLLSSIAIHSTDNIDNSPTCSDLQKLTLKNLLSTPSYLQDDTVSEFSPITMKIPENAVRPLEGPCFDSNDYTTPPTGVEFVPLAQRVPQIPSIHYAPYGPINQMIDRNWIPHPFNFQNILQPSPAFIPAVENAPVPFISNTLTSLTPNDLKLLSDLASQSKTFPQLSMPNISTPMKAIPPLLEWTIISNSLPLEYIPSFPIKNSISSIVPSNLESSICNPEYTPIEVDDTKSLLDEYSYKLLNDLSILPLSQSSLSSTKPLFETGEIVSPSISDSIPILNSDSIKTRPLLPFSISNAIVPPLIYTNPQIGLYDPQNLPHMIPTSTTPPHNSQPYAITPIDTLLSEILKPVPKIESLPIESADASLQLVLHEIENNPEFIQCIPDSTLKSDFLQQLLSKPCFESPINLPSSTLDTMLQLSTDPNKSKTFPSKFPPEFFTPVPQILTTPLSSAFTSPVSSIYASPLSVSYAKPILASSPRLPSNVPYALSPLTPLLISPLTTSSAIQDFSSPLTPLTNYPAALTETYKTAVPSRIPYKPSQMYSTPYPSSLPVESSPYAPTFMSQLAPAKTSPIKPVFYKHLRAPFFTPVPKPKTLSDFGTSIYSGLLKPVSPIPMASPTGELPPFYFNPDLSTYEYSPIISAHLNTLTQQLSTPSPVYVTPIPPVNSILPSQNQPLPSQPTFNLKPEITSQELENLGLLSTLPISNANKPFLNVNQMLPTGPNITPTQNYYTLQGPLSSSQIKQNKPTEDKIGSNLQTTSLIEETPYENIEENMYTFSNNYKDMIHEKPNLKHPLESLSYTLASEEIKETELEENFIKQEDLIPSNNIVTEPSKLHKTPLLTPYTSLYSYPLLTPCPIPQLLPLPSPIETIPQNTFANKPQMPLVRPWNQPLSLTTLISSSQPQRLPPLLAPEINEPLLQTTCTGTYSSPYKTLLTDENPLSASESATSQDMFIAPPLDPRGLIKMKNSQVTVNAPFVSVTLPKSSPKLPYNLNNYIKIPPTHNEAKSNKQDRLVRPLVPSYNQFASTIISPISSLEMLYPSQEISPLTPAENLKKPLNSPQYISSILPTQTKLQENYPLNEALLNYKPYVPLPLTGPSNAVKNIFKSPSVPSLYSVIPSVKMGTNLNSPQSSPFAPQYSLPGSSLPVSKSSSSNSLANVKYSTITPDVAKLPITNHIIPSSPFMSSDTSFQTIPLKKSTFLQSLPRYCNPTPTLMKPLEIFPHETPGKPLGQSILPQNMCKPNTQYYNDKYKSVPFSSSLQFTQPLEITDSSQTQPFPFHQCANKPHPKLSPILPQYASPSLTASYSSLPMELPSSQINKPRVPEYSFPTSPITDASFQSSALTDFRLIKKIPSYPIPNNQITSLKSTPYETIISSNLRPLDISKEDVQSYSSPITSLTTLSSSSLLKPLTKTFAQKSRHYQPQMIPINSQYVNELPSFPQLLPLTTPLLDTPLLNPLSINSLNFSPSLANYVSKSNVAFSESPLMKSLPSVSSTQKYFAPSESLVSVSPESLEPVNSIPTTPSSFSKPPFYKQHLSPVTMINMPKYSNYDEQESSRYLPLKENYKTVIPVEVSPISSSESSRLSFNSPDTGVMEDMVPYELMPESKHKFSQLPLNLNQQKQLYPVLPYLTMPQQTYTTSASSSYKTARPRPLVIPEDVELIDTTDPIPISPIQSEALTSIYSPTDRTAPKINALSNIPEFNTLSSSPYAILSNTDLSSSTFKQFSPKSITNTQSTQEPDRTQSFPYNILSNSDFSPPNSNPLPPIVQKQRNNQRPQSSPVYLSPQEYEELTKASIPSPITLPSSNTDPQLITNALTARPIPLKPLYASLITKSRENLLPFLGKHSPLQKTSIDLEPDKENIQSLLNKYRAANKLTLLEPKTYPYESKPTIVELISELHSTKPENLLIKTKESYVEYAKDIKSNDEYNDVTAENVSLDENKSDILEAKLFTENEAETIEDINIPNYYNNYNGQKQQRLSISDHFYANNHIGKSPQVFSAAPSPTDGERFYDTISPKILKDLNKIPTKQFGFIPKLDTNSRLIEYYPETADSAETIPTTSSHTRNYINPLLQSYPQMELPTNAVEVTETSEVPSTSYYPSKNIDEMKYSGYKTYQIPSMKFPKTMQNLGTPTQTYTVTAVPYSSVKSSNEYQNLNPPDLIVPAEIYKPKCPQYQTPEKNTSPLQSKLGVDTLQNYPEFNEYDLTEDKPVCIDDTNEEFKLKTSLINYINKKDNIKSNIDNNNIEFTVPIGNIAIIKKELSNADTIEINNPSIGLKVWKSKIKIAEAELKLKFKDLSVINFMPVINNLDKYDIEEIRNIVKNYIDEKYGKHIEINEPYTVDNQYTVIKDFDPNPVSNKFNLLWPTNYV